MILSASLLPIDPITGWRDISHSLGYSSFEVSIEMSHVVITLIMITLMLLGLNKKTLCCINDQLSLIVRRLTNLPSNAGFVFNLLLY